MIVSASYAFVAMLMFWQMVEYGRARAPIHGAVAAALCIAWLILYFTREERKP